MEVNTCTLFNNNNYYYHNIVILYEPIIIIVYEIFKQIVLAQQKKKSLYVYNLINDRFVAIKEIPVSDLPVTMVNGTCTL